MASWYELDSAPPDPTEEEVDVNSNDDIQPSPLPNDNASSIELGRPHEPSRDLDSEFGVRPE